MGNKAELVSLVQRVGGHLSGWEMGLINFICFPDWLKVGGDGTGYIGDVPLYVEQLILC